MAVLTGLTSGWPDLHLAEALPMLALAVSMVGTGALLVLLGRKRDRP